MSDERPFSEAIAEAHGLGIGEHPEAGQAVEVPQLIITDVENSAAALSPGAPEPWIALLELEVVGREGVGKSRVGVSPHALRALIAHAELVIAQVEERGLGG